jgi:hypothetical protein
MEPKGEMITNIVELVTGTVDQFKIPDLLAHKKWGNLNFAHLEHEVTNLFSLLTQFNQINLNIIPLDILDALRRKTAEMYAILGEMKNFTIHTQNPTAQRDGIVNKFHQWYSEIIPPILQAFQIHNLTHVKIPIERIDAQSIISKQVTEAQANIDNLIKTANDKVKQLNTLVDEHKKTVNQVVQEFGMRNYAEIFKEESQAYGEGAKIWLASTIILLAIAIGVSVAILFAPKDYITNFDIVQFTITKIVIITGLFYGVAISLKSYKAQKHNQILNKHRRNALLTFEAFTKSSKEDPQTKSAVLLAATHTIFGNQSTGYSTGQDSNDSDLPSKIIEIIKTPNH